MNYSKNEHGSSESGKVYKRAARTLLRHNGMEEMTAALALSCFNFKTRNKNMVEVYTITRHIIDAYLHDRNIWDNK